MAKAKQQHTYKEVSNWVGWIYFAGFMLVLLGFFHILTGVVALFKDDILIHTASGSAYVLNYTAWGWTHIAAGILAWLAGSQVMRGKTWARVLVVVLAVVSALANMAFVPIYPVWSLLMITIDVLIIYAVTVHGRELEY